MTLIWGLWTLTAEAACSPAYPAACVDPSATIDPTATVSPGVTVGAAARVGGASELLRRASVGPSATVGAGVVVGVRAAVGASNGVADAVFVGPDSVFGARVQVGAGATVSYRVQVADDARIGAGASVGREASIGARAVVDGDVGPDVDVGAGATIGTGARVRRGASIGAGAVIGVGARVGRDVVVGPYSTIGAGAAVRADAVLARRAVVAEGGFVERGGTVGSSVIDVVATNDVRRWADGTLAPSCLAYRNPGSGYLYGGDVGDGLYRIQPPGKPAYDAWCDMDLGAGGWTVAASCADVVAKGIGSIGAPGLTAPNGIYLIGTSTSAARTYCDLAAQVALCSEVQGNVTGTTKDASALPWAATAVLRPDTGVCELWNVRHGTSGHPFDRIHPKTGSPNSTCEAFGFLGDELLGSCSFGSSYSNCGFPVTLYRYGDACNGCSSNNGTSYNRYVFQGPMSSASVLTNASGSVRMYCRGR